MSPNDDRSALERLAAAEEAIWALHKARGPGRYTNDGSLPGAQQTRPGSKYRFWVPAGAENLAEQAHAARLAEEQEGLARGRVGAALGEHHAEQAHAAEQERVARMADAPPPRPKWHVGGKNAVSLTASWRAEHQGQRYLDKLRTWGGWTAKEFEAVAAEADAAHPPSADLPDIGRQGELHTYEDHVIPQRERWHKRWEHVEHLARKRRAARGRAPLAHPAHRHLVRAEQALRASGHHEHADAVSQMRERMNATAKR